MNGAADISIIFHGYQPGRCVGTKLIELPGYSGSAEAASVTTMGYGPGPASNAAFGAGGSETIDLVHRRWRVLA